MCICVIQFWYSFGENRTANFIDPVTIQQLYSKLVVVAIIKVAQVSTACVFICMIDSLNLCDEPGSSLLQIIIFLATFQGLGMRAHFTVKWAGI